MLFDEHLRDAVARDRSRQLAEGLRHCEFDVLRRGGLLARWRARRAAPRPAAAVRGGPPAFVSPHTSSTTYAVTQNEGALTAAFADTNARPGNRPGPPHFQELFDDRDAAAN